MIKVIESDFDKKTWNALAPHPMQSWEWGEARAKMGIEVLRIGEFKDEKLINVFQLTLHKIPHTFLKIGYLPRSVFPSKEVTDYIYEYGKENFLVLIKVEPNIRAGEHNDDVKRIKDDKRVLHSPAPLFPKWTQTIDLTKSEDELLKQMKPKTRYNIRLAQKKGVTVKEESTDEGFETFIKLYFETTARQKYYGHNREYHEIISQTLRPSISHILISYYEGKPLGAYELFLFNDVLYYPYGGSSLEHKEVMAPNLLMWEAIRFGKKHGAKSFDLWGSLAPNYDKDHMWSGFTRFKEGYGAEFTEMIGSYDIVVRPLIYKVFNIAQKIRERRMS